MEKEEKQKNHNLLHKVFLIILKYVPHLIAFIYALYTLFGFCGIDVIIVGCFFHISIFSWIYLFITSILFKFCYVHRLPLYYIGINELITSLDYYIGIPIEDFNLIIIHSLLIISLIFGYSYYHIKCIKRKMRDRRKFCKPKTTKYPLIGDVEIKLKCGHNIYVKVEDYLDIKQFFKINSIVGEIPSAPGAIKVVDLILEEEIIISPEAYVNNQDRFDFVEIIGERKPDPFGGYAYVDLGLPSGTLWATMNIGATSPEEYGNYYMYSKGTTQYNSSDSIYSGYTSDEYDTAILTWGNGWKQAGTYDTNELTNGTTRELVTINSVPCIKLTGQNGNYIIIPTSGKYVDGVLEEEGEVGYFWGRSGSPFHGDDNDIKAYGYNCSENWHSTGFFERKEGFPVRAIHSAVEIPKNLVQVGDVIVHSTILDEDLMFSFDDWLTLDDTYKLLGLYGITTYDAEDSANNGDYIIMANGHTLIVDKTDYSLISDNWEIVSTIDLYNNQDYVDFGLPSRTIWATMNVGAATETGYGDYYMFGKLTPYNSSDAPYEDEMDLDHDVAREEFGGYWHIPSKAQCDELIANTDFTFETDFQGSGINGGKFTSKTDSSKYIFIPAAGRYTYGELIDDGVQGDVFTSTLTNDDENQVYTMYFNVDYQDTNDSVRTNGHSIRPVLRWYN